MEAALLASLDLATLEQYRLEAVQALHQLRTGKRTVQISHQGQSRTHSPSEADALERYIGAQQPATPAPRLIRLGRLVSLQRMIRSLRPRCGASLTSSRPRGCSGAAMRRRARR